MEPARRHGYAGLASLPPGKKSVAMGIRAAFVVISLVTALLAGSGVMPARAADPGASPEDTLFLDLDYGRVVIRLRPDLAPKHVARIKHLARGGFYDGMVFHRVIDGFMAQTGDPKSNGTGGSGRMLEAEFTRTPQVRGTVGMARTSAKNSADSQWYIVLSDNNRAALDGQYTAWGQVTSGMEFVDKIRKGNSNRNGTVTSPDKIVRMQLAADAERPAGQKLSNAALLKAPEAAAAVRDFSGGEFRCTALLGGAGVQAQAALAPYWVHGFLAGHDKAQGKLTYASGPDDALDAALLVACETNPQAFLIGAASQELVKAVIALPATPGPISPATYACKDYVAGRNGADKAQADFAEAWAFAFIQGFKTVGQPGLEIPFDAKAQLLGIVAANCTKNPDVLFADLTALVAEKLKLK